MPDIVNILGSYLNFTTRPVTGDGPWGLYQGNGTWTGMVGQLVSRSVDIVSAGLTMTVDRQRAVDFTAPILVEVTNSNLLMQTYANKVKISASDACGGPVGFGSKVSAVGLCRHLCPPDVDLVWGVRARRQRGLSGHDFARLCQSPPGRRLGALRSLKQPCSDPGSSRPEVVCNRHPKLLLEGRNRGLRFGYVLRA